MKVDGVHLTKLNIIPGDKGSVMHFLKKNDPNFHGFGEVYISTVDFDAIKGWKCHKEMILNIVVPVGSIEFHLLDGRRRSKTFGVYQPILLTHDPLFYSRLTIPSGIWVAFRGNSKGLNMLINIANIPHDPKEAASRIFSEEDLTTCPKDWL